MTGKTLRVVLVGVLAAGIAGTADAGVIELRGCRIDQPAPTAGSPDTGSGIVVSLERDEKGSAVVRAEGHGLTVRKTVAADGSFNLAIAANGDALTLRAAPGSITIGRAGRQVAINTADPAPEAGRDAAVLLAGSPAVRAFRAAVASGGATLRQNAGGAALYVADVVLRVLQDDPSAVARLRPEPGVGMMAVSAPAPRPCFREWESEVLDAWGWYEGCYGDFSWWSGGREACAFVYVLRVEAAWFQLLTCVGFKS